MLEVKGLYKNFDGVQAVQDFSLKLESGKVTSLIGPKWCWQTTVFNIVTGFSMHCKGKCSIKSENSWCNTVADYADRYLANISELETLYKAYCFRNYLVRKTEAIWRTFTASVFSFSENSSEHRHNINKA